MCLLAGNALEEDEGKTAQNAEASDQMPALPLTIQPENNVANFNT